MLNGLGWADSEGCGDELTTPIAQFIVMELDERGINVNTDMSRWGVGRIVPPIKQEINIEH